MASKEALLTAINAANGTTLSTSQVIASAPLDVLASDGSIHHSTTSLVPVDKTKLIGKRTVSWTRPKITSAFNSWAVVVLIPAVQATFADVLASIAKRYGVQLLEEDFVAVTLDDSTTSITLTPQDGCFNWHPSVNISVQLLRELVSVGNLQADVLPGFDYQAIAR